jgi:tape measure domain-containing protein
MPDFAVRTAFTAVDKISPAFRNMESSASSFQKTASRAFMAVGTLVSGYLINSFIEAAASAERMNVAFGSVFGGDAASQMGFVRDEAKRLGLDLQASADAYKSISAAAKGSAISNAMVKEVFIGVSEGAAALQLSSEQTSGALTALSQMISKGKVQAEELRGQLGERIPGAFQIAARAMNMTTSELDKFMSDGKLTAELFIPRFAAQMRKEFGPAAMDAANSFSAARNRFNNAVFDFEVGVGSVLLPALSDLMLAFKPVIDVMGQFFRENQEGISEIIKLVPWLVGGFIAWKFALLALQIPMAINTGLIWGAQAAIWAMQVAEWAAQIATWALTASNWGNLAATIVVTAATWAIQAALWAEQIAIWAVQGATWAMTAAQWALNAAFDACPIVWIIALIVLLVAAVAGAAYAVYKNWEPISEFFSGLWDGIVSGFNAAIDWIIQKFTAVVDWISKKWQSVKAFFGFAGDSATQANNAMKSPNESGANLQAGNTNVNIYSNGTEAKAEVTPRKGATINMNRLGYQQ